jgi:hypothetical protein
MAETAEAPPVPRVAAVFVQNYGRRGQLIRAGTLMRNMPRDLAVDLLNLGVVRKLTPQELAAEKARDDKAAKAAEKEETPAKE